MPQENVETWRANIEALRAELIAGTNPEATISKLAEIWDTEIELDASESGVPGANGVYRGTDAVREFWRQWFSAWQTLQFEYELVDAGERVAMLLDLRMRGRSTGIEVPFGKIAWLSTFQDGLIVHIRLYMSQSDALEVAGLSGCEREIAYLPPARVLDDLPRRLDPYVFHSPKGKALDQGSQFYAWREVRASAGLRRIRWHDWRHFCATQLLELGLDHFAVSIQLGHTDGGALVMARYGHPSADAARRRLLRAFELDPRATGSSAGSSAAVRSLDRAD